MRALWRVCDRLRQALRRNRWPADKAAGRQAEDIAHRLLQDAGLIVVARNYRTRTGSGEVDLVAWEGETVVFVEVKSRASEEFGAPDRAIGADKRLHILRAARDYARRAEIPWNRVRFDIVTVVFDRPPRVAHTRDAFHPDTN